MDTLKFKQIGRTTKVRRVFFLTGKLRGSFQKSAEGRGRASPATNQTGSEVALLDLTKKYPLGLYDSIEFTAIINCLNQTNATNENWKTSHHRKNKHSRLIVFKLIESK